MQHASGLATAILRFHVFGQLGQRRTKRIHVWNGCRALGNNFWRIQVLPSAGLIGSLGQMSRAGVCDPSKAVFVHALRGVVRHAAGQFREGVGFERKRERRVNILKHRQ